MPEITLPGLREVGNGPSENQHQHMQELRQAHKVQLWNHAGTEEECEASWREYLLQDTPDWIILS